MKKSGTKKKKRPKHRASPGPRQPNPRYAAISQKEKETVMEIIQAGRTGEKAREVGLSAQIWTDHALRQFEWTNALPRPIACTPGCDHCCHNQVEVAPPEALVIGHFLERLLPPEERDRFLAKLGTWLEATAGKSKEEIARLRRELPCPLLQEHRCSAYPVRPLVCRAMHSLDAGQCEASLRAGDLTSGAYYAERHDLVLAIVHGLQAGCQALNCQSGILDLAQALQDYFRRPEPGERWIKGEAVFSL
ncbi:MAG: YkgJ family cysteine cluster protein [Deltaproteobacteria bacterium]|nr:YkgJ family cysteine cluster protein [Deltaproteobacteria bacterium]